jgi:hypothetical protein
MPWLTCPRWTVEKHMQAHLALPPVRAEWHRRPKKPNEAEGNNMEPSITLDQPIEVAETKRKEPRNRRPLPPQEARDWMTPIETGLVLGCSVATVHRLRRGVIPGVEPLPCSQYGRKVVFRKASIARWQDSNEQRGLWVVLQLWQI